jgi:hypothetical protein
MITVPQRRWFQWLVLAAATSLAMAACDAEPPAAPEADRDAQPAFTALPGTAEYTRSSPNCAVYRPATTT